MPVRTCKRDGKSGYKWGREGFCYVGANSKELASRQGKAIEASKSQQDTGNK